MINNFCFIIILFTTFTGSNKTDALFGDPIVPFDTEFLGSFESLKNITKIVNESVTLRCPEDQNIEWKVFNSKTTEYKTMSYAQIFRIENITIDDDGIYSCYSHSKLISTYNLRVYQPPYFLKKNYALIVKPAGNMAQLKCQAKGYPTPNITWLKDGAPAARKLGKIKYVHWSLTLEEMTTDDRGNYTCVVCNILACINFTYRVDVVERFPSKPMIKDGYPKNVTVLVNTPARFECPQLIADLEPYIEWFKYSPNFTLDSEAYDEFYYGEKLLPSDGNPEILELTNVTQKDEGWYGCTASNSLGSSKSKAYLKVLNKNMNSFVISGFLSLFLSVSIPTCLVIFGISVLICLYSKGTFDREKREEKLIAIEMAGRARSKAVCLWAKNILIEKDNTLQQPQKPIIRIRKVRVSTAHAGNIAEYHIPIDVRWEILREDITLKEVLGEGAFGQVVKAEINNFSKRKVDTTVAIKMLKVTHDDEDMINLISEMEIMKSIGSHPNIINLLGCCTQDGPLYIIVEYAPYGNLKDFLIRKNYSCQNKITKEYHEAKENGLPQNMLLSYAVQVSRGMEYLASKKCLHRDLAARNVLVSENFTLKIGDFGLARDINSKDYYKKKTKGLLPIKWMAPEAISHRLYTTKSDVWSYGVLLWEIMTLGETPYQYISNIEELLIRLRDGYRMKKPLYCLDEIYEIMMICWEYEPTNRPTFSDIVKTLDKIMDNIAGNNYLDLKPIENAEETVLTHELKRSNEFVIYETTI